MNFKWTTERTRRKESKAADLCDATNNLVEAPGEKTETQSEMIIEEEKGNLKQEMSDLIIITHL